MLSLIIPTYNERENIRSLLIRIFKMLKATRIKAEVIVVDDNSPDGTGKIVESLRKKYENLLVLHRKKKLGLASAVLEGIRIAGGDIIGVMDADGSHPISKLPQFFRKIKVAEFVLGTRYTRYGKIKNEDLFRRLVSTIATWLARPLVGVSDPCSGFFFFRKKLIKGKRLKPIGYKIGLEIMVKCSPEIIEIPYTFIGRKKGKSKFNLREIFNYLLHLSHLYIFKLTKF